MKLSFFWSKFVQVSEQVFSVIKKNPTIVLSFLFIGLLDGLALTILFLAPSQPVATVMAPVIRTFWGEQYLHYPNNFLLLPKLFSHAHFIILSVAGVFVTGLVIKKIEVDAVEQRNISVMAASRALGHVYGLLFIGWLATYGIFTYTLKSLLPLIPSRLWIQVGAGFFIGLILQALFGFVLPAIAIERKFFRGVARGLTFGFRNLGFTAAFIFVPMLFVAALSLLKAWTPYLIEINPELVIVVLAAGIGVTLLADLWVTSFTAVYFVTRRVTL